MTAAIHKHMLSLPLSYFQNQKAGDLVTRIVGDTRSTANSMESLARGLMVALTQVSVTAIILFKTDPLMTTAIAALGVVHLGITKTLGKRVRIGSREVAKIRGELGSVVHESVMGIRITKTFATEKYESKKVSGFFEKFREASVRYGLIKYYESPMRMIADAIVIGGVIQIVFYGVASGRLTMAGAAMFIYLSQQITGPLGNIFSKLLGLTSMLGSAQRIEKVFRTINPMLDGSKKVPTLKNKISIKDISFSYDKNVPVIEDISFEINKGQMVALVGTSGAGKSTLADLILRLDDVDKGSIFYDGINIKDFKHEQYRRKFGVVFQECLLFNGTVRENILLDRKEVETELQHSIWAANAQKFIQDLPEGLDTIVGDRGLRLSGGQRQRVAIARAIYGRPTIIVLDEATSALDSESERAVQEAIDRVSREVTTIVIAHRLSTVQHADKIVILGHGRIEAIGTHSALLDTSKTYRRLCELQFMQNKLSNS
jgi:ABC-type multidrug transport system fused ATPase/permease subunit